MEMYPGIKIYPLWVENALVDEITREVLDKNHSNYDILAAGGLRVLARLLNGALDANDIPDFLTPIAEKQLGIIMDALHTWERYMGGYED